jgi:hypothetical protein
MKMKPGAASRRLLGDYWYPRFHAPLRVVEMLLPLPRSVISYLAVSKYGRLTPSSVAPPNVSIQYQKSAAESSLLAAITVEYESTGLFTFSCLLFVLFRFSVGVHIHLQPRMDATTV